MGSFLAIAGVIINYYSNKWMLLRHSRLLTVSDQIGRRIVHIY
jgi:hypothetical protein